MKLGQTVLYRPLQEEGYRWGNPKIISAMITSIRGNGEVTLCIFPPLATPIGIGPIKQGHEPGEWYYEG